MPSVVNIAGKPVGEGQPVFVVAEIGINHNGDLEIAKKLIDVALLAGCDAVKFQKRTPELCVPEDQRDMPRETPWGIMSYLEYRKRLEFGEAEYREIDRICRERGLIWYASCWDEPSVKFLERFSPPAYKLPSACITNERLVKTARDTGKPVIMSTGMSTMKEIEQCFSWLCPGNTVILHCVSTYPAKPQEINLRMIDTLRRTFGVPVGYSGHEVGLQITLAAVALGACMVERHITLDRSMWGSDQAASVEPWGLMRLVRDIRVIEAAMGDGNKRVWESELPVMKRLRGSHSGATHSGT
ncbi:MAG: N-acetylneuraminate synthase family protein [Moorellales bacterium]